MLNLIEGITLNGIHLYQDDYIEDDDIIFGTDDIGDIKTTKYIIANKKIMGMILSEIKKDLRIKKLNEILDIKDDNNDLTLEKIKSMNGEKKINNKESNL